MTWVNDYIGARYRDGARGEVALDGVREYDCWGLVREARHKHCGCTLLPSWGHVRNDTPREFTRAYESESERMERCEPEHGAIAACFRGRLCTHVAVVVDIEGTIRVLEISIRAGVRLLTVTAFESRNQRVEYYRDKRLP